MRMKEGREETREISKEIDQPERRKKVKKAKLSAAHYAGPHLYVELGGRAAR